MRRAPPWAARRHTRGDGTGRDRSGDPPPARHLPPSNNTHRRGGALPPAGQASARPHANARGGVERRRARHHPGVTARSPPRRGARSQRAGQGAQAAGFHAAATRRTRRTPPHPREHDGRTRGGPRPAAAPAGTTGTGKATSTPAPRRERPGANPGHAHVQTRTPAPGGGDATHDTPRGRHPPPARKEEWRRARAGATAGPTAARPQRGEAGPESEHGRADPTGRTGQTRRPDGREEGAAGRSGEGRGGDGHTRGLRRDEPCRHTAGRHQTARGVSPPAPPRRSGGPASPGTSRPWPSGDHDGSTSRGDRGPTTPTNRHRRRAPLNSQPPATERPTPTRTAQPPHVRTATPGRARGAAGSEVGWPRGGRGGSAPAGRGEQHARTGRPAASRDAGGLRGGG